MREVHQTHGVVNAQNLRGALRSVPNFNVQQPYTFGPNGDPNAGMGLAAWNDQTLPCLHANNAQAPLKQEIMNALQNHPDQDLQSQVANANQQYDNGVQGGGGPILYIPRDNTHQTIGALNMSSLANNMVKCITAYRVYRLFKVGRTGDEGFDEEDSELLESLSYLGDILQLTTPNATEDLQAVTRRLEAIYDHIYARARERAEASLSFNPDLLCHDTRFNTTRQTITNLHGVIQQWNDPVSQWLVNLPQNGHYRMTDLVSIIADGIKLMSQTGKKLTNNQISELRNSIEIVGFLLSDLHTDILNRRYHVNGQENLEMREGMELAWNVFSRDVYTSIAKSLNTIMGQAVDEYHNKLNNMSPTGARASMKIYKGLIAPAEKTCSAIGVTNKRLLKYGERTIDNSVLSALDDNKEIVKYVLGA